MVLLENQSAQHERRIPLRLTLPIRTTATYTRQPRARTPTTEGGPAATTARRPEIRKDMETSRSVHALENPPSRDSVLADKLRVSGSISKGADPTAPTQTPALGYEQQRIPARRHHDHRVGVSWHPPVRLTAPLQKQ